MIEQFLRRWAYRYLLGWVQRLTGIQPHYRVQYQSYLYGPRWFVIRNLRVWWDGWNCVDCGARHGLQVHHNSYRNKGKGTGIGEFFDCVTVCDGCHEKRHK